MNPADIKHRSRMLRLVRLRQQALAQEDEEEARRHRNILRRARRQRLRRDSYPDDLNRPDRVVVPQPASPVAPPPAPLSRPLPDYIDSDASNDEDNFLEDEKHKLAMGAPPPPVARLSPSSPEFTDSDASNATTITSPFLRSTSTLERR